MMTRISNHVTCEYLEDSGIYLYKTTNASFKELKHWQRSVIDQVRKWNSILPLLLIYDLTQRGVSIPYSVLNNYNIFNVGVTPDGREEIDRLLRENRSLHIRLAVIVPESVSGEISKRLVSEPETRRNIAYRVFMKLDEATAWLVSEKKEMPTHVSEHEVEGLLTHRETEILKLVMEGRSNQDVADMLTISVGTVKWHLQRIYRKFDVQTRTQAVVKAHKFKL
jgi:DNA-binding CsgD family transcriptional regulator